MSQQNIKRWVHRGLRVKKDTFQIEFQKKIFNGLYHLKKRGGYNGQNI